MYVWVFYLSLCVGLLTERIKRFTLAFLQDLASSLKFSLFHIYIFVVFKMPRSLSSPKKIKNKRSTRYLRIHMHTLQTSGKEYTKKFRDIFLWHVFYFHAYSSMIRNHVKHYYSNVIFWLKASWFTIFLKW